MVPLLQDFLRAVGLTVGLEGPSVLSVCISSLSVSDCPSPASGVCVAGDRRSVTLRTDLFGGAVLGLTDEHLFDFRFTKLTLVTVQRLNKERISINFITCLAHEYRISRGVVS